MKYYAVRRGKKTGIFTSWDACKESVTGYSGAEYKSFSSQSEAEGYLSGNCATQGTKVESKPSNGELFVYVDGSFDQALQKYAFGCVFIKPDGTIVKRRGNGDNAESLALRNITGEMLGAMYAVRVAIKSGYKKVKLFYDYEGIEKWATGAWNAYKDLTIKYANEMKRLSGMIDIEYVKVVAHSNNYYNEMVDAVAKGALKLAQGIPKIEAI